MHRVIVGAAALFIGVALNSVPMPAGAGVPSATVTPSHALTDGKVVRVRWSGYSPRKAKGGLLILQCSPFWANGTGAQCDQRNPILIESPIRRRGSVGYTVRSGTINTDSDVTCATSSDDNNCVILIAALDRRGQLAYPDVAAVPISFTLSS